MRTWLLWLKNFSVGAGGVLFFLLGVDVLRSAYALNNPHEFIVYFFSSSLMILISAVAVLYPIVRIYALLKQWWQRDGSAGC
jgi:hypothetical protein